MRTKKLVGRGLGGRERQIMDVVYRLGQASVAEVRESLSDPPSYSAVRTMMGILERKELLKREREDVRHIYFPTRSRASECKTALMHLVSTFFDGSASKAFAALLEHSAETLSIEELDRLQVAIDQVRNEEMFNVSIQ